VDWDNIERILLVASVAYLYAVFVLRLSGKRTLAKLNAFDLIVTVALGSTLATIVLSKDVTLTEGTIGFSVLIGLQFGIAWLSTRSKAFAGIVKSEPRVLLLTGKFQEEALRRERVTEDEVCAAVRSAGYGDLALVFCVVLETDGSLSVIAESRRGNRSALDSVAGDRDFGESDSYRKSVNETDQKIGSEDEDRWFRAQCSAS